MTKLEIIDETVKFYSEDINRRAIIRGNTDGKPSHKCVYLTPDQRMCAFGRCMTIDSLKKAEEKGSLNSTIDGLLSDLGLANVDDVLRAKYIGHSTSFWADVQILHDRDNHWDQNGLTKEGEKYVSNLKEAWNQK